MKRISNRLLVFILTVGVFGILNTEMGIVGVIPYVSERYGVSIPDAGFLVSGFALIIAVAGPTMALLFSRVNRKLVMLLSLGIFTVCNALAIVAPTYEALLAFRVIPAAFHPLYVSLAMSIAQVSGDTPQQCAKASAQVFVGVSAGMVVGAPIAGLLASCIAFPAAMAFFAVVTAFAFVLTAVLVPSIPVSTRMSYGKQIAVLKKPLFVVSLLAAATVNAGMFGFYSYLADYLGAVGFAAVAVSGLLFVYGLMNVVGNVIAGRALGKRPGVTMVVAPALLIVLYGALFIEGIRLSGGVCLIAVGTVLIVLGIVVGVANTTDQYLVSRAAPEAPDFANGLFLTATNVGTTIGTSICGVLIDSASTLSAVVGALPCVIIGIGFILARLRLQHAQASFNGKQAKE